MPSRSPFGARMQWPEPAHTEQSLARRRARRREVPCGSALHSRRRWPSIVITSQLLFTFLSVGPAAVGAADPPRGGQTAPGRHDTASACPHAADSADVLRPRHAGRPDGDLRQRPSGGHQRHGHLPTRTSALPPRSPPQRSSTISGRLDATAICEDGRSQRSGTPDTSGSSSGTASRIPDRRQRAGSRCSWPGRRGYVGRTARRYPGSATATDAAGSACQLRRLRLAATPLRRWR